MNVSGMSEIIESGMDGVLIDQRSGESLANGVKQVMEDSSLKAFIIQNARSKIKEKFSEEQMLKSLRRVYQEIQ
jgi:glycosyltransferase involved in cell wall biosynthesis